MKVGLIFHRGTVTVLVCAVLVTRDVSVSVELTTGVNAVSIVTVGVTVSVS